MADRKRPETVLLPQVNPGNAELALQAVRTVRLQRPVSTQWLEDHGITQPKQTLFLLRFLGVLDDSDCLVEALAECRRDGNTYADRLRELAIDAYAGAGVGGRDSLGWLGRDAIAREEIKARLRGPFAGHDLTRGGHKNAFYCLSAVHELLRDRRWLRPVAEDARDSADESRSDGQESTEVIQARVSDANEARKLVGGLVHRTASDPRKVDEEGVRVTFSFDERGEPVTARIHFESPMRPGDYARLGRMLQAMASALEENAPTPDRQYKPSP